jgi:hypothetical protein
MALKKCTECGQIFDGNLKECPNSTVEVPDSSQDIKVKADTTTETTIESVEEESLEYEPIADADESLTEYTDEELFAKGKEYFFNESFDHNISNMSFPEYGGSSAI